MLDLKATLRRIRRDIGRIRRYRSFFGLTGIRYGLGLFDDGYEDRVFRGQQIVRLPLRRFRDHLSIRLKGSDRRFIHSLIFGRQYAWLDRLARVSWYSLVNQG